MRAGEVYSGPRSNQFVSGRRLTKTGGTPNTLSQPADKTGVRHASSSHRRRASSIDPETAVTHTKPRKR